MEAKIAWKSENMRKKAWRKSMLNFDVEKYAKFNFGTTFWVDLSCLRQYTRSGPGKVRCFAKVKVHAVICSGLADSGA